MDEIKAIDRIRLQAASKRRVSFEEARLAKLEKVVQALTNRLERLETLSGFRLSPDDDNAPEFGVPAFREEQF